MNFSLKRHTKNAYLYDTEAEYVSAYESKVGRDVFEGEKEFLLKNACSNKKIMGSKHIWGKHTKKVIGTFNVCDICHEAVNEGNDIVKVLKGRVGRGICDLCSDINKPLRKISVDNFTKKAIFITRKAQAFKIGDVVRIMDTPSRFNELIGDIGEIANIEPNHKRGLLYTLVLETGLEIPIRFTRSQLEQVDSNPLEDPTSFGSDMMENEAIDTLFNIDDIKGLWK